MRSTALAVGATAALALGAVGLVGCQDVQPGGPASTMGPAPYNYPPPPPPPPPPGPMESGFSPQEFAWSLGAGAGSLSGRVSYHAVAGERWTCAAQTIALIPATRYSASRMIVLYGSQDRAVVPAATVKARNAERPGIDYGRFVRTAACDAHDGFSIAGLPPGPYFLVARARPRGHSGGSNEGVVIMQRVDIAPGPTRIVVPQP